MLARPRRIGFRAPRKSASRHPPGSLWGGALAKTPTETHIRELLRKIYEETAAHCELADL